MLMIFHINIVINSDDKTMLAAPNDSLAAYLQIELLCLAFKIRIDITDFKNRHRDFYRNV